VRSSPLFKLIPYLLATCFSATSCKDHRGTDANQTTSAARRLTGAIPPRDALSTFELEPGFKIELVASEPLISDPVDMEIDEYGRMYVVEMHGYPLDKSGTGIIKLLSDQDGDGTMDSSAVFADGLTLPNSVMRWKKGILVTDAPNVIYLEDTNNDGKSDIRDTMLTGFALSNPQHNLNTPLLGIDNWIYLGHEGAVATQTYQKEFGDTGTAIRYPGYPKAPQLAPNASGRSVRFRPDQHLLEETSSNTQFGHTFDTWGHHLLVSNWNHIFHEVIAASYLERNPNQLVSEATQSNSDHKTNSEVFPITTNPDRQLLTDVGVITSACGLTYYQGGLFPAPFDKVTFVAEPVSNLVHVDKIKDSGASFVASRIHERKEFLASTDAWFRPVNMYVGPDGALYVVDYYRQIIEHPEWMGEEVVKSGQLYNGHDMGRIYRISPTNAKTTTWTKNLKLGDASNEELVQQLANPNSWWRMNAQRLLVDRNDKSIIPSLDKMASNTNSPVGLLHALWTLEGMNALQPALIEQAFQDAVAGVRENAVKLAELHLLTSPALSSALLTLQDDPDPKVRFQLLCTLGSVNTPAALVVRNKLLFRDLTDKWVQVAALSGPASQTASLLNMVIDSFQSTKLAYSSLVKRLGTMIGGGRNEAEKHQLLSRATSIQTGKASGWQAPLLEGLAAGLESRDKSLALSSAEQQRLVETFFADPSDAMRDAAFSMLKVTGIRDKHILEQSTGRALAIIEDQNKQESGRVQAIHLIAFTKPAPNAALMKQLISPTEKASVQVAALEALSAIPDTSSTDFLLKRWSTLTPEIQDAAMNTFLEDDARIKMLLNAIETGEVLPSSVGWQRSVHLMAQRNLILREKARQLLTKNEKDREKVNEQYKQALTLNGDPANGKTVYQVNCSSCHMIRGSMGVSFGPDLGTVHNWSAEAIMANILAPNLSISSGYDLWSAELKNGESFQGIISSETATAITLINAARVTKTINRSDLKSLKAMNMSSMPTGLEKNIAKQQMADLIAFLRANDQVNVK